MNCVIETYCIPWAPSMINTWTYVSRLHSEVMFLTYAISSDNRMPTNSYGSFWTPCRWKSLT